MDPELIIYLIFLAIVFIARLFKKSAGKPGTPSSGQGQSGPRRPAKSFEELLEEFTTGNQREEPEEILEEEYSTSGDYSREEYESAGREEVGDDPYASPYGSYQGSQGSSLKTLDEMVEIEKVRTTTSLKSDEEEEEEESPVRELGDMLRNPDDARKAIILSEIIRRRY